MQYETICLKELYSCLRGGTLKVLCLDNPWGDGRAWARPAVIVVPGGAYAFVSKREGEPVAANFLSAGYQVCVLEYLCSADGASYPEQLFELGCAVDYLKSNAERLHISPKEVFAVGFSAGGHLAGMLGTMFNRAEIKTALGQKATLVRPDAMILAYPVITGGEKAHGASFYNLFGGDDYAMRAELSIEKNVTANSSPAFIWTTVDDDLVPSENSLLMATALKAAGVPFELHMFESGHHGLSLATEETGSVNKVVQKWFSLSVTWLTARGFVLHD